jgi:glutamine---fructose-6-phosphate transaminase (isomerizing)
MNDVTPFERDIAEQPAALRRLAAAPAPDLGAVIRRQWDRIVLTGMGSSHFAGVPTWRRLTALGLPAWTVDSGQLLDNLDLITARTLLVATSQSGASGEIVQLLDQVESGRVNPALVVGITDDAKSHLASAADVFLPLHSGPEATVSTKSYLNTLGVHRALSAAFAGEPWDHVAAELTAAADTVQTLIDTVDLSPVAAATARHPERRLAYVARGDEAATALFSALITKEASKVPAEGYIGGQFRHGPLELAGDGLTVVLFGLRPRTPDESLRRLAADLVKTGSTVVAVGDDVTDALSIPIPGATPFELLAGSAVVAERFAVDLARANGVVPGEFLHGSKITTAV